MVILIKNTTRQAKEPAITTLPPVDPRAYRNTVGAFATGVTAIAAGQADHLHVMTANAVTSVSLDPLLILFCLGQQARMVGHLQRYPIFSVNILRYEQADLSAYFAGVWKGEEPPHFEFVSWRGTSLLEGCAAAVACEVHQIYEGGDHWIVLGKVIALYRGEDPIHPLIFHNGKYRRLRSDP